MLDINQSLTTNSVSLIANQYSVSNDHNIFINNYSSLLFKPYLPVRYDKEPTCQNIAYKLTGYASAAFSYKWFINDTLISSESNPFLTFRKKGINQLKVIVADGNNADTVLKTTEITEQPLIDTSFTIYKGGEQFCTNSQAYLWTNIEQFEQQYQLKKANKVIRPFTYYFSQQSPLATDTLQESTTYSIEIKRSNICGTNYATKKLFVPVLLAASKINFVNTDPYVCNGNDTSYIKAFPTPKGTYFEYFRRKNHFGEMQSVEGKITAVSDTTYLPVHNIIYNDNRLYTTVYLPCPTNNSFVIDTLKVNFYNAEISFKTDQEDYFLNEPVKIKLATNLTKYSIGYRGEKQVLNADSTAQYTFSKSGINKLTIYGYKDNCADSSFQVIPSLVRSDVASSSCDKKVLMTSKDKFWPFKYSSAGETSRYYIQDMVISPDGSVTIGGTYIDSAYGGGYSGYLFAGFFIAKFDNQGKRLWEHHDIYKTIMPGDMHTATSCSQVKIDEEGNTYFSGTFMDAKGDMKFFGQTFPYPNNTYAAHGYIISLDKNGDFRWWLPIEGFQGNSAANPTQLTYIKEEKKLYYTIKSDYIKAEFIILGKNGIIESKTPFDFYAVYADFYFKNIYYSANRFEYVPKFNYIEPGKISISAYKNEFFKCGSGLLEEGIFSADVNSQGLCSNYYPLNDTIKNYISPREPFQIAYGPDDRIIRSDLRVYRTGLSQHIPNYFNYLAEFNIDYTGAAYANHVNIISSFQGLQRKHIWDVTCTNLHVTSIKYDAKGTAYVFGFFQDFLLLKDGLNKQQGMKSENQTEPILFAISPAGEVLWLKTFSMPGRIFYQPYALEVVDESIHVAYLSSETDFTKTNLSQELVYEVVPTKTTGNCSVTTHLSEGKVEITTLNQVYPNPSRGEISIRLNEDCIIEVYKASGEEAYRAILNIGMNTLNLSHLDKGLYMYKAGKDKGKFILY